MAKGIKETKEIKYALPMEEIKKDLYKTLFFAGFAVVFLMVLHFGNVSFSSIVGALKALFGAKA